MLKLLIEGVRFIPHSYACVNMWQCLELLKRNRFALYHNETSICDWNLHPREGLFSPEDEESLRSIPPLRDPGNADIVYRIDFPHRFDATGVTGLFVFVTAEFNAFPFSHIADSASLRNALLRSAATIITPSEWSRQRLVENGADEERVSVVPHGVAPGTFKPLAPEEKQRARVELGWSNDFVFFNCGCMAPNKGIVTLLKSFAVIARRNPTARLCLKGLDTVFTSLAFLRMYKDSLTAEEKQSIEGRVSYLGGSLSFAEMAGLYQAADTYVAPYMAEAFSLPVLEAAGCGIPVICTQGGPTDEFTDPAFAKHIRSTRVYTPDRLPLVPDEEHLIQLMQESIDDTDFRIRASVMGPQFVHSHYTWRRAVDRLEQVFLHQ